MRAREARERQRASVGPQHRLGNAFTASSRFLLLRSLEQLLERKFRGEPVKRHRGEPGHTHGTHGRTRAQGSHRRTSQPHPNPPTHPQPHDHDRIRGRLNSRRPGGGEWRGGGGTCAYWVAGKKTPGGAGTHRGTHGRTSRGGTRIATQTEPSASPLTPGRLPGGSTQTVSLHTLRPVNSFHFRRHTRAHHTSVPDSAPGQSLARTGGTAVRAAACPRAVSHTESH